MDSLQKQRNASPAMTSPIGHGTAGRGPVDLPIIFSAPMVCALLDGRKTMTRRLAWRDRKIVEERDRARLERKGHRFERQDGDCFSFPPSAWQRVRHGDRLWVRESHWRAGRWIKQVRRGKTRWKFEPDPSWDTQVCFEKPNEALTRPHRIHKESAYWPRPSIFLPRALSRLTLIVITATKIERLQKISNLDAIAEGCGGTFPVERFRDVWAKLHGMESWDENPEVVALAFTVHKTNIDARTPPHPSGAG